MRFYIQEMNSAELRSQMGPGASDVAQFVPELRQLLPELETSPILEPSPITLTRLVTRVLRSWTVSPGTRFDAAFLSKPFSITKLADKVRIALSPSV